MSPYSDLHSNLNAFFKTALAFDIIVIFFLHFSRSYMTIKSKLRIYSAKALSSCDTLKSVTLPRLQGKIMGSFCILT